MKLSAIFLVTDYITKTMQEMDKNERLNYLLGIHDNQSFITYMLDMIDLIDAPVNFYECLQKELLLDKKNLPCLYSDQQTDIYLLTMDNVTLIKNHYQKSNSEADELITDTINLLFSASKKEHNLLLVFND